MQTHNWKFLLASQIIRGLWAISPAYAEAAAPDLHRLFSPDQNQKDLPDNLIEHRGSFPLMASSMDQEEGTSYDEMPQGSIAVFKISGVLLKYGTWCSYGTEEIMYAMQKAAMHPNIAGALIEMDSGGGAVSSVPPFLEGISAFKSKNKPTLSLVDVCCSAALWDCSFTDFIMASNNISATIGSVGIMQQWIDMAKYFELQGIFKENLYPLESAWKNKGYEMALKGDFSYIKEFELAPAARQFQDAMKSMRGNKLNLSDEGLLQGKMYGADEALKNGFIDGIGNRQTAIDTLFYMIESKKYLN